MYKEQNRRNSLLYSSANKEFINFTERNMES